MCIISLHQPLRQIPQTVEYVQPWMFPRSPKLMFTEIEFTPANQVGHMHAPKFGAETLKFWCEYSTFVDFCRKARVYYIKLNTVQMFSSIILFNVYTAFTSVCQPDIFDEFCTLCEMSISHS